MYFCVQNAHHSLPEELRQYGRYSNYSSIQPDTTERDFLKVVLEVKNHREKLIPIISF